MARHGVKLKFRQKVCFFNISPPRGPMGGSQGPGAVEFCRPKSSRRVINCPHSHAHRKRRKMSKIIKLTRFFDSQGWGGSGGYWSEVRGSRDGVGKSLEGLWREG